MDEGESVENDTRTLALPRRGEGRLTCASMVHRNPAPRLVGARLPFAVLFFGRLAVKFRALTDRDKDLSRYRNMSLSVHG
jgi:hypothetical protein